MGDLSYVALVIEIDNDTPQPYVVYTSPMLIQH